MKKERKNFTFSLKEVFSKKGVLKNVAKFTGKHLFQSLFSNKVSSLRPATLLKMRFWHRCFLVTFARFVRTVFLKNTSGGCFCTLTNICLTILPSLVCYLCLCLYDSKYVKKKKIGKTLETQKKVSTMGFH